MPTIYENQLAQCEAAIAETEKAQSISVSEGGASRNRTNPTLATLYAERARLTRIVSRQSRGGGLRVNAGVDIWT